MKRRTFNSWRIWLLAMVSASLLPSAALADPGASTCSPSAGLADLGLSNHRPTALTAAANLVYTGDAFGLTVYDASDPSRITALGSVPLVDRPHGLEVAGGLAFVAGGRGGLQIVDVHDPAHPTAVGSVPTTGLAWDLAVSDSLVYLSDTAGWLHVVDARDPSHPLVIGSASVGGEPTGVALVENHLVALACGDAGLQLVRTDDPRDPAVVTSLSLGEPVWAVTARDNRLYTATENRVLVLEVGDDDLTVVGEARASGFEVWAVALTDQTLFLGLENGRINSVDISEPSSPAFLGGFLLDDGVSGLSTSGSKLFAAADYAGWAILDSSDPAALRLLGQVPTAGFAQDIEVFAGFGYVADSGGGLVVLDLRQESHPRPVTVFPPFDPGAGLVRRVHREGSILFVLDGSEYRSSLEAYSLADPGAPQLQSQTWIEGKARDLTTAGNRLFVTGSMRFGDGFLSTFDISDPAHPSSIGRYESWGLGSTWRIAASEETVFLGLGSGRVVGLDVRDPSQPQWLSSFEDVDEVWDLSLVGGVLYAAASEEGVAVLDASDPRHLLEIDRLSVSDSALDISTWGNSLIVSSFLGGVQVLDISEPQRPLLRREYLGTAPALAAQPAGRTLWVAGDSKVEAFDMLACPNCSGLAVSVEPEEVTVHGQATIQATLKDPNGELISGQVIEGTAGQGSLSPFEETRPGVYSATYTAGEGAGEDRVTPSLNGMACSTGVTVRVKCDNQVPAATGVTAWLSPAGVELSWSPVAEARGYEVYRGDLLVGSVPPAQTSLLDSTAPPVGEFCYFVRTLDGCGSGEWSEPVCVSHDQPGDICLAPAGRWTDGHRSSLGLADIVLIGETVLGAGRDGLAVFQLSPSQGPVLTTVWSTHTPARFIAHGDGGYLFLSTTGNRLYAFDVQDPTHPRLVARMDPSGEISALAASGRRAVLVRNSKNLEVIDFAEAAAPRIVGSLKVQDGIDSLALHGNLAAISVTDPYSRATLKLIRISPSGFPQEVGELPVENACQPLAFGGSERAYCAESGGRVVVLDISDPGTISELGTWGVGGTTIRDLRAVGTTLFLAAGAPLVVDFSDPGAPVELGRGRTSTYPIALDSDGTRIPVATAAGRLEVADTSHFLRPPQEEALVESPSTAQVSSMLVLGSLAYISDWALQLRVFDLSSPESPQELGSCQLGYAAFELAEAGGHIVAALGDFGVQVVDVGVASEPTVTASLTDSPAEDLAVAGSTVFFSDGERDVHFFDVSDPTRVRKVPGLGVRETPRSVSVSGDRLFVVTSRSSDDPSASGYYCLEFDISDPGSPTLIRRIQLPTDVSVPPRSSAASETRLCVSGWGGSGTYCLDLTAPASSPLSSWWYRVGPSSDTLRLDRDTLLRGASLMDLHDLSQPRSIISVNAVPDVIYADLEGPMIRTGSADVEAGRWVLQLWDVSDALDLPPVAAYSTPLEIHDVAVSGSRAFVAGGAAGLVVVDLSDPDRPRTLGRTPAPEDLLHVASNGSLVVGLGERGCPLVFDVSTPSDPQLRGFIQLSSPATRMALDGPTLFAATEDYRLIAVDLRDPSRPEVAGSTELAVYGQCEGIQAHEGLVATLFDDYGRYTFLTVDFTDSQAPMTLGSLSRTQGVLGFTVSGRFAYLTTSEGDLEVVTFENASDPELLGSLPIPDLGWGVAVHGSTCYVGTTAGIAVIDVSSPAAPAHLTTEVSESQEPQVLRSVGSTVVSASPASLEVLSSDCRPPQADFSWEPRCAPYLTVQFRGQGLFARAESTWLWDFGDGSTSGERDPVHHFTRRGTYTVRLTISNDSGVASVTHPVSVGLAARNGGARARE